LGAALIAGLAIWLVSTLARGALIAGASAADGERNTTFGGAFAAGWGNRWTLLGIAALPALPALLLLLSAWIAFAIYARLPPALNSVNQMLGIGALPLIVATLGCVALPLALVLHLLRTFANRACMLEGRGVLASYGRGGSVLLDNLGSALILFLIQVGIGIALALFVLLSALCCAFWPLLLLAQGTAAAFFATVWTLAWKEWTAIQP
jgi:hypothetical protein